VTLSVIGANFVSGKITVRIGTALSTDGTFVNSTLVTAPLPAGLGSNLLVTVSYTVDNAEVRSTSTASFSYERPVVASITPSSFHADSATQVLTIAGRNFGPGLLSQAASQYGSAFDVQSVYLGTRLCPGLRYVSDTSLTCTWTADVDNEQVRVTIIAGGQQSTSGVIFLQFLPNARTTSVYPDRVPTVGGTILQVSGASFVKGKTKVAFYNSSSSFLGYATCVQYIDSTKLLTLSPWGLGVDVGLKVEVDTYVSPKSVAKFSYEPPSLSKICFTSSSGGTLQGKNFGVQAPSSSTLVVGAQTASVQWVSNRQATFTLPNGAPASAIGKCYNDTGVTTFEVGDEAGGGETTAQRRAVISTPAGTAVLTVVAQTTEDVIVTLVSPNFDNTRGSSKVTITGYNFGAKNAATVQFPNTGLSPCVEWVSSERLIVTVPSGYGAGYVSVTVTQPDGKSVKKNGQTSSSAFSYRRPEVYAIQPLGRLPTETNSVVTIRGRYFGWRDSQPLIQIGNYTCDNLESVSKAGLTKTIRRGWVTDSEVYCRLQQGGSGAGRVSVMVGGLSSMESGYPIYFSFETPKGIVLPTAPTALRASLAAGENAFRITWAKPYNTGSGGSSLAKIAYYEVQVSAYSTFSVLTYQGNTTGLTQDVFGLLIGITYYIRVAAVNDASRGSWATTTKIAAAKPDKPWGLTATASAPLSLRITFNRPNNTGAGGYLVDLVQYMIRITATNLPEPITVNIPYNASVQTVTQDVVNNIFKGVVYDVSVVAFNEIGSSGYTTSVSIQAANVPSAPQQLSSTQSSPGVLRLTWAPPIDTGYGDATFPLIQYQIVYSSQAPCDPVGSCNEPSVTVASTAFAVNVTATAGSLTSYYVRAISQMSASKAIGKWASGTVQVAGAPSAPQNLRIQSVYPLSSLMAWDPPAFIAVGSSVGTETGRIVNYSVETALDQSYLTGLNVIFTNQNTTTNLTGLVKGQLYFVRVRAQNQLGWYGTHSSLSPTTLVLAADLPTAPTKIEVTNAPGDRTLRVNFDLPLDSGDGSQRYPLTGFVVQYSTTAGFLTSQSASLAANARLYDVSGLQSGTLYYVRVAAVSAVGQGSFSAAQTGTPIGKPDSPSNLAATISGSAVQLSWSPPSDGLPAYYRLTTSRDDNAVAPTVEILPPDGTIRSFLKTNLVRGKRYTFTLEAGNIAGLGSPSTVSLAFDYTGDLRILPVNGPLTPVQYMVTVFGRVFGSVGSASPTVSVTKGTATAVGVAPVYDMGSQGGTVMLSFYMPVSPDNRPGVAAVQVTAYGTVLRTTFEYGSLSSAAILEVSPLIVNASNPGSVDIVTKNFGAGITAPPQASDFAVTINTQSVAATIGTYDAISGIVVLRASVPTATAAGSATVTVKTGSTVTASLSRAFLYVTGSQIVRSVYPQAVTATGGSSVTVVGTGFSASALAALTTVTLTATSPATFAGSASTTATVSQSSSCNVAGTETCFVFTAPALTGLSAGTSGIVALTISLATAQLTYFSVQPVIVSVSPTMGLVGSSTNTVELIVAGLSSQVQSASDVSISFAGILSSGTKLTFNNNGYAVIRTVAPLSSLAKDASIVVNNAYSSVAATTAQTYSYASSSAAQVHEVTPSSGAITGGTQISVRLRGTSYSSAASAQFVLPSGTTAAGLNVFMYGDDLLSIRAPASPSGETGASTVNLVIGSYTATFSFTYEVPITAPGTISFVQPLLATIGDVMTIVVSNFNRFNSAADVRVSVGPALATVSNIVTNGRNDQVLMVTVPAVQVGQHRVAVSHATYTTNTASQTVGIWGSTSDPYIAVSSPAIIYDQTSNQQLSVTVRGLTDTRGGLAQAMDITVWAGVNNSCYDTSVQDLGNGSWAITATVPSLPTVPVRSANGEVGIVTLRSFTPPILLPFKLKILEKPKGAAVVESVSTSRSFCAPSTGCTLELTYGDQENVTAILSNFQRTTVDKIGVMMGQVSMTVLSVASDTAKTVLVFQTRSTISASATARNIRISTTENPGAANDAIFSAKVTDKGFAVVASTFPAVNVTVLPTVVTVKISNVPFYSSSSGSAISGPSVKFNGNKLIPPSRIQTNHIGSEFYAAVTIDQSDILVGSVIGAHFLEFDHPQFTVSTFAKLRASFRIEAPAIRIFGVSPSSGPTGVAGQLVTLTGRNLSASSPLFLAVQVSDGTTSQSASIVSGSDALVQGSTISTLVVELPDLGAAGNYTVSVSSTATAFATVSATYTATPAEMFLTASPRLVSTTGGASVSLVVGNYPFRGSKLTSRNPVVSIGGVQAAVSAISETRQGVVTITVVAPPSSASIVDVLVSTSWNSYRQTAFTTLTYSDLIVEAISTPYSTSVDPTRRLVASSNGGGHFAFRIKDVTLAASDTASVTFGGMRGAIVAITRNMGSRYTQVEAYAPMHPARELVQSSLALGSSVYPFVISFVDDASFRITNIYPDTVSSTSNAKVQVTLVGVNGIYSDSDLNTGFVVEVAGVPAVQLALVSASFDTLAFTFVAPTLSATEARQVPVTVRYLGSNGVAAVTSIYVYNFRPYIVRVAPSTPTVGQTIELQIADLPPVTSKFQLGILLGGTVLVAPQALLSSSQTSFGTLTSLKVQIPANAPVVSSAGQLGTLNIGVIDLRSGSANVLPGMPAVTVVVNTDSAKRAEFVTPASIEKLSATTSIQLGYVMSTAGGITPSNVQYVGTFDTGSTAVSNLANATISAQYPTFGTSTRRQLVSFDIPTLPKSLTAASIGTVQGRILEKNLVSGGMTSVYYELNVLDKDYSNVVESVKPDAVDVYGGGLVTVTIYKFNNGIAVTAAQTRVLFGTSEATVLSVVSSSTRTTVTFVAPAGAAGQATGFVAPSMGNAVSFSVYYTASCDYSALCGPQGIIPSLIAQQPPSAMMCSTKYCSSRYDLPELQYATKRAYTGVRSKATIGVKNVASLQAEDLDVVFVDAVGAVVLGTVESVTAVGPALAEVTVITPYVEVPAVVTMRLSSRTDATGYSTVSSPFTFYDRPTGSSVVTISPAQGSVSGGTTITVTVSNFPVISFATEARVRLVVGTSTTVADAVRLVSSDYKTTVLLVTSPMAAAVGANQLEVSYLDNSIYTNVGRASWVYQAAQPVVVSSYPSSGPISGGFELLAILQGFPQLTAATDVNFTFNGFTGVPGSTLLYSTSVVSKVKVVVPAADIGAVSMSQKVKVQHSSVDNVYAWFDFVYTIVDLNSVRVTYVTPSSTSIDTQVAVQLYVANFPTVSNLTEVMVTFGNLQAPVLSAVKSGTNTVLTVNSPVPSKADKVRGAVFRLRDGNRAGSVGTFEFTYTQPTWTISPSADFGGNSVTIVVPSPGSNSNNDWSVSFGDSVATIVSALTSGATTTIQVVSPASSTAQSVEVVVVFVPQKRTWRSLYFEYFVASSVVSLLPRRKSPGGSTSTVYATLQNFPIVRADQITVTENGSPVLFEVTQSDSEGTVVKVTVLGGGSTSNIVVAPVSSPLRAVSFEWVYAPVELSFVSSSAYIGSTLGGETINVVGRFSTVRSIGVIASDVSVRFGERFGEVVQVSWDDPNDLVNVTVTTPSSPYGSYQLEIAVGDWTATSATDFVFAGTFSSAVSATTSVGINTASTTVLGLYSFGISSAGDGWVTVGGSYPATISSVTGVTLSPSDVDPCSTANDGVCDVPSSCSDGDYVDCKVRRAFVVAPSRGRVGSVASAVVIKAGTNTVAKAVTVNNAPGIVSARYDAGRAVIRVEFDMATNQAGMTSTTTDCGLVVVGDFGSGSACTWESTSVLVIRLGYGVNWLPGTVIQLVAGKLRAQGGTSAAASASFGLGNSLIVKSPRVAIEAPARISPCADIDLKAIGTLRSANLEYFWSCPNDVDLNAFLSVQTGQLVWVPNTYLTKTEFAYKITLTARIQGTTARTNRAEATIYRSALAEVTTVIRGQSFVKAGSSIDLGALLDHSECPVSATAVTFAWTIDPALNSTSVNTASPFVSIPTTALTALQSYSFSLTTSLGTDTTSVRTTQFNVSVVAASATPTSTYAPTRGRCFATWSGESTIWVSCEDFEDPSGSDIPLRYEFGYFNASAGWSWFGPSVDFSSTYCVPSGAFEPWARITSSSGVTLYSKAVWRSWDLPVTYLTTVASLSSSSVSHGGIGTNTVGGKYMAWGLLRRQDLLSQCTYVWASDPPIAVSSSARSDDLTSLISYMSSASGGMRLSDTSLATPVLQAAGRLSKVQVDLAATSPGTAVNTAIAATLCSLSSVAKFAAQGLPLAASLDSTNVTGALQAVASIAQSNKYAVASGVATANSSCAVTVNSDFYAIQQATATAIAAAGLAPTNLYHGLAAGSAVSIDVFKVANNSAYTVSSGTATGPGFFTRKTVPANWAFTNPMISAAVHGYSLTGSNLVVDILIVVDKTLAGVTTLSAATVSCTAYSNGAWVRESTCKAIAFGSTTVTCRCTGSDNDVLVQFYDVAATTLGCDGVAGSGKVPDACGVCGGTNSTCTGCDGVVNSRKVLDACGVCGGTNSTCVGCDGIPNSGVGLDVCFVCGGDGTSCLGCAPADGSAPLPLGAGGLTFDQCGVCGGNGSSCVGCDNIPYSKKKFDACGICGGAATKRGCVSAFVTPAEGARFAVTSGQEITVTSTASASDNDGQIQLKSFTPGASYKAFSLTSVQTDGVITATFKWTPSTSGSYPLCVNLYSRSSTNAPVLQASRCVTIEVTFCEYVAQSGDTLSTISQKEFGDAQYWRTLWWLNPTIAYKEQPLVSGTRVSIGRVFTVQGNNTVEFYINRFGGTFGKLVEKNPLKLDYLQGGSNYVKNQVVARPAGAAVVDVVYKDFERRITYDGVQYCIVSQMDSYQRA